MKTILITGCGGNHFLQTLPCYNSYRVIAVASELYPGVEKMVSRYEKVDKCESPRYIEQLIKICKTNKVDVLVPTIDAEMKVLADNIRKFIEIGVKVAISNIKTIDIVTNKAKFADFLEEKMIKHPKFSVATSSHGMEEKAREIGYPNYPICMKMTTKGGSRGFRIIDDNHDYFDDYANKKPNSKFITMKTAKDIIKGREVEILLQEYLAGEEYSTDMVCDNGRVIAIAGRRNIAVDNSIPLVSVTCKDEFAYELSKKIAKELELDGNIGIDFIRNDEGLAVPIEVNPRITATVGLFNKAGLNLPDIQVKRLLGEKYDVTEATDGVKMIKTYTATYEGGV